MRKEHKQCFVQVGKRGETETHLSQMRAAGAQCAVLKKSFTATEGNDERTESSHIHNRTDRTKLNICF
jgi:RNA-binding protein YhbY